MRYNTLMQPGDTIKPGGQPSRESQPAPPAPTQEANPAAETPIPEPVSNWSYQPSEEPASADRDMPAMPEITWTASEYIAHDKGPEWFMGLAVVAGLGTVVAYIITRDFVTAGVILLVAIIFGVFAARQPRVLTYRIDHRGITIADKHYPYMSFRSFAVQDEGALNSIFLIPMKRFMPGLNIYFPPEHEMEIVNTLGNYLPHEERPPDAIDRLMRKVRF